MTNDETIVKMTKGIQPEHINIGQLLKNAQATADARNNPPAKPQVDYGPMSAKEFADHLFNKK
jgi:hypothetical protein